MVVRTATPPHVTDSNPTTNTTEINKPKERKMSENSKIRTVAGRYVSYRYYGDTSATYGHGGIVVIATHHDKDNATVYGGLCIVPDYVTKRKMSLDGRVEMTSTCPHKYEQKAARAIADSRLHYALFGTWSEELEAEIRKHATWAPDWRPYTEAEITSKAEAMRATLPGTSEEVEARVARYAERLRGQRTPDVVDPIHLRRVESTFKATYGPGLYDSELTSEDIDGIVSGAVIDMAEDRTIPAWVAGVVDTCDDLDDEAEYDTSKPCVVDLSDGEGEEFGLAMVHFRDDVCVGYDVVEEGAVSVEALLEQVEAKLDEISIIHSELNEVVSGDSRVGVVNVSKLDDLVDEDSSAFDALENDTEFLENGGENIDAEDETEETK